MGSLRSLSVAGALAVAALASGCGASLGTEVRTVTRGDLCVDGDTIRVRFRDCLSSSCDTVLDAGCTATWASGTVLVTAQATIERSGGACTDDCGFIDTACPLPVSADPTTDDLAFGSASQPIADLPDCATLGL